MRNLDVESAQPREQLFRYDRNRENVFSKEYSGRPSSQEEEKKNNDLLHNPALLSEKVGKVQEMSDILGHSLEFDVREEADVVQIVVKDKSSGDVIKQIPPEKIVKFLEGMQELLGALFDEKF